MDSAEELVAGRTVNFSYRIWYWNLREANRLSLRGFTWCSGLAILDVVLEFPEFAAVISQSYVRVHVGWGACIMYGSGAAQAHGTCRYRLASAGVKRPAGKKLGPTLARSPHSTS